MVILLVCFFLVYDYFVYTYNIYISMYLYIYIYYIYIYIYNIHKYTVEVPHLGAVYGD